MRATEGDATSMLIHSLRRAKDCCTQHCSPVQIVCRPGWQLINCFLENVRFRWSFRAFRQNSLWRLFPLYL